MNIKSFFDFPQELEVVNCDVADKVITLTVVSTQMAPCCPLCETSASRIHSQYSRQLTDLPCAGQRVRLILHVRKFFCDETTCARKIEASRLAPFIQPWARVTTRLFEAVENLGLATSGMLGARLGHRLGMQASWMTVLRRVMALATLPVEKVAQLGIDVFSLRRGRRFGTILVDMQSHEVIDVLPDRKAETATAWIAAHPEIELVSRDRGGDSASAATIGAPQAIQCADRFHLLKNLGEALQGVLARHLAAHRRDQTEKSSPTPLSLRCVISTAYETESKGSQAAAGEARGASCPIPASRHLTPAGFLARSAIADQVGIGHATVSRWLGVRAFPEQQARPRKTGLDSHLPFLRQRWEAGCHNIAQLYRELVARGYNQSYESVYEQLIRLLPGGKKNAAKGSDLAPTPLSSRQATFLFLRRPQELETDEQETLLTLRHLHPETDLAYDLVQQFAQMLRTRTGEQLDDWLEKVRASQIRELQSVVLTIERDKAAVVAGLTLAQNNGLVEGHLNKLKLMKRMGYGRAGFPLLRQRVLHAF